MIDFGVHFWFYVSIKNKKNRIWTLLNSRVVILRPVVHVYATWIVTRRYCAPSYLYFLPCTLVPRGRSCRFRSAVVAFRTASEGVSTTKGRPRRPTRDRRITSRTAAGSPVFVAELFPFYRGTGSKITYHVSENVRTRVPATSEKKKKNK